MARWEVFRITDLGVYLEPEIIETEDDEDAPIDEWTVECNRID